MADTTISVPEDLADELYERKGRGESYADVIRQLLEVAESDDSGRESPPARTPDTPTTDTKQTSEPPATPPESFEALVDAIAEESLPGSGEKATARAEAFRATVAYLKEHGEATPTEFQEAVYPDHPAFYTDGQNPARSWWKNCIYKGLRELAEQSDAVMSADQSGTWRYVGGES